jgi:hypothetical protein
MPPGLRLADRSPQPRELLAGQEPLAAVLPELLDPTSRIHSLGDNAAASGEGIHAADDGQDAIGLERGRLELPVQPRDLRSRDLVGLSSPEFRLDDFVQEVPVEGDGSGLALLLDVLGHEPVGQASDRERAAFGGLLSRRVVTMGHRSEDGLCPPSGGLRRRLADVRDGEAPDGGAAPSARPIDHDVRHGPARPHADPEARELAVPDGELPCLRLQAVDNALGDPLVSHGCPAFGPKILRGSTGETPKRKSGEPHGSRIHSEIAITRAFLTVWES